VTVETIRDALSLGIETTDSNHVQNMITLEKTDSVISRNEQAFYLTRIFCLIPVFFLEKEKVSFNINIKYFYF